MSTAPTKNDEPLLSDALRTAIEAALRETFGAKFQLWSRQEGAPREAWQPFEDGTGLSEDAHRASFDQAAQPGTDHVLARVGDAQWLVVLPIRGVSELELLASAVVTTQDPDLLVRLVSQARRQIELQWQVQMLSEERDLLICQIKEDLEELAFLRRTAEHLSLSDMSLDITELAKIVLPELREQLHAEAVVLVSAGRDKASCLVGRPVLSVGRNRLDDRACTRLVEQFRSAAVRQPVVKNGCQGLPEFQGLKGLRSFILTPMMRSQAVIAWVLAINRLYTLCDVADHCRCEASHHEFGTNEVSMLRSTAAILATHATNIDLFHDKEQLFLDMVRALVNAVEAKDRYTFGHSERVGLYAKNLGAALGLKAKVCKRIYLAGLLHDVGKIAVRDNLLSNSQHLDDQEFADVQRHAEEGWGILYGLAALDDVLVGVLHHHERWDGKGYPDGLRGDTIPLDARILAVTDAYDAMTSDRPYRQALPQEKAEEILRQGAGTQWDPEIVAVFLRIMPETLCVRGSYEPRKPPARRGYGMLRGMGFEQIDTDAAPV